MAFNRTLFALQSAVLQHKSGINADTVNRFFDALVKSSDWDLFRINPYRFATKYLLDPEQTLALFVHGVREGLFDMEWGSLCVFCGATEYLYSNLAQIPKQSFHCQQCSADIFSFVDERIEVLFRIASHYGTLDVDPFSDPSNYRRYYLSPIIRRSPEFLDYLANNSLGPELIKAQSQLVLRKAISEQGETRIICQDKHCTALLKTSPDKTPSQLLLPLSDNGFSPSEAEVSPNDELVIHNSTNSPCGILVLRGDHHDYAQMIMGHPPEKEDYLSAQGLLAFQVFRDLFKIQNLPNDLALNVRTLSVLFTDLKGSTSLYERLGDASAFTLVRQHFRWIRDAVTQHKGAIVKTIGDAVMAVFSTPLDAVRAALVMQQTMATSDCRDDLLLRVGVHCGPALVVSAEGHMDYFGRTVNVAARLESTSGPDEVVISKEVSKSPGVARAIAPYRSQIEQVSLRGVLEPFEIVRLRTLEHA